MTSSIKPELHNASRNCQTGTLVTAEKILLKIGRVVSEIRLQTKKRKTHRKTSRSANRNIPPPNQKRQLVFSCHLRVKLSAVRLPIITTAESVYARDTPVGTNAYISVYLLEHSNSGKKVSIRFDSAI